MAILCWATKNSLRGTPVKSGSESQPTLPTLPTLPALLTLPTLPTLSTIPTLPTLTTFQICLKHRTPDCRDRVILRMRTCQCVRQNNALIGSSMMRALGPYWLPKSYNRTDISKLSHST
jgi:hypothetical protein